ncbi:AAA family ATPase [Pontibacter sp. BT731]|uniref:ATP-dependent nuclease n=1 Tax=Pontibacter coccineus TaxID=3063328 RepID=UPI0026E29CE8|nr:AAA family ATPase [Pontibacter sp. BT731]MDO6392081.1 AAA family ATPase [Pontibacter sp. BT731]
MFFAINIKKRLLSIKQNSILTFKLYKNTFYIFVDYYLTQYMYISEVAIKNYRNFQDNKVIFTPGLNVLIGHNNAGKTNLIKALQLVFERKQRSKPTIEDFNSAYTDFSVPPSIEITVTITEHDDEEEDKNIVYDWLLQDGSPYSAQLTYIFALPAKYWASYSAEVELHKNDADGFDKTACFKLIEKKYLQKYVSHIYGGDPARQEKADPDLLDKFDFQFLDAIRDAERQMFYGNNTLLRDVLNYFLDYDITEGKGYEALEQTDKAELIRRENEFSEKSTELLQTLIDRISRDQILEYSEETGATKGGRPDFDAKVSELELLFALRLIVEKQGFKLPIKNNGLGYNNLLFIALILAKMQMERSSFMGDNAKVFPILAIEEPEAHLHPSMQYKFLKFLNKNLSEKKQARQVFITSHSTQITSAVELDSIICFYEDHEQNQRVAYPAKTFSDSAEDQDSKAYVKRFLDATKSNMLFADKIVFVEGLAEQLLLPCFAAYLDKEQVLVDSHVAIVSVDSRTFKHFLKIFAFHEENSPFCIKRKVVCITDADPSHKLKEPEGNDKKRWKSCYPVELHLKSNEYEYKPLATHAEDLFANFSDYDNIKICTPVSGVGKTLEYELAISNPGNPLLLTDAFPGRGKNKKVFFEQLMQKFTEGKSLENLLNDSEHEYLKSVVVACAWDEPAKRKAFIASVYHGAVESAKGEHAFYLERQLRDNLAKGDARVEFTVPTYIADSITFISE